MQLGLYSIPMTTYAFSCYESEYNIMNLGAEEEYSTKYSIKSRKKGLKKVIKLVQDFFFIPLDSCELIPEPCNLKVICAFLVSMSKFKTIQP